MAQSERARRWYEAHKALTKARAKRWNREHPEKVREKARKRRARMTPDERAMAVQRRREWREANPEKVHAACHNWYLRNKDRKREQRRAWSKRVDYPKQHTARQRAELHDCYVLRVLTQGSSILKPRCIPPLLVEAKRAHLKLRRLLKDAESTHT